MMKKREEERRREKKREEERRREKKREEERKREREKSKSALDFGRFPSPIIAVNVTCVVDPHIQWFTKQFHTSGIPLLCRRFLRHFLQIICTNSSCRIFYFDKIITTKKKIAVKMPSNVNIIILKVVLIVGC